MQNRYPSGALAPRLLVAAVLLTACGCSANRRAADSNSLQAATAYKAGQRAELHHDLLTAGTDFHTAKRLQPGELTSGWHGYVLSLSNPGRHKTNWVTVGAGEKLRAAGQRETLAGLICRSMGFGLMFVGAGLIILGLILSAGAVGASVGARAAAATIAAGGAFLVAGAGIEGIAANYIHKGAIDTVTGVSQIQKGWIGAEISHRNA